MNKELAIEILKYWHKIEFFQSTDIKDLMGVDGESIQVDSEQLATDPGALPWINRNQIRKAGKGYSPNKTYSYKLFLGIFQREEIADEEWVLKMNAKSGSMTELVRCTPSRANKKRMYSLCSVLTSKEREQHDGRPANPIC